jgi:hypothetical protein
VSRGARLWLFLVAWWLLFFRPPPAAPGSISKERASPAGVTDTRRHSVGPPGLQFLFSDPGAADSLRSPLPLATIFRASGAPRPGYHIPRLRRSASWLPCLRACCDPTPGLKLANAFGVDETSSKNENSRTCYTGCPEKTCSRLHPSENGDFDYKYVVMPMRI